MDKIPGIIDHVQVKGFELGLDPIAHHFLGEFLNHLWWIDAGLLVEIQGTQRRAAEIRFGIAFQLDTLGTFFKFQYISPAGGNTQQKVPVLFFESADDFSADLLFVGGFSGIRVSGMQMHHIDTLLGSLEDLFDDLLRIDRHMQLHGFDRDHSSRREFQYEFFVD